jgi:hypothetical protein
MSLSPLLPYRRIEPGFIRACYYFGRGWPINCWSCLLAKEAARDFAQIRRDGFNTVILLVPWRGFQPDLHSDELRDDYLRLLRRLLRVAQCRGLRVILRLSYAHHICDEARHTSEDFSTALLSDAATRRRWQRYLARIEAIASQFPNYSQSFISWEEFWGVMMRHMREDPAARAGFAQLLGYGDWLAEQGLLEVVPEVPLADSEDYVHYHRFANTAIRRLYDLACEVVPELGFEIRVDRNRLHGGDGSVQWLANDSYIEVPAQRYTYWAPFIGALNQGERLNASQAAALLEQTLREVTNDGLNTNHVVNQLNYIDDTFKYAGTHARITPTEVREFLQLAALLLLEYARGYGVWAWRDYLQNSLFNPRFVLGLEGWRVLSGSPQRARPGPPALLMRSGDAIAQHFLAMNHGLHNRYRSGYLQLRVEVRKTIGLRKPAQLQATLDGEQWFPLAARAESHILEVQLPTDPPLYGARGARFGLRCVSGRAGIVEVALFQHIYRVGFRQFDGRPGEHLKDMLYLNAALRQLQAAEAR